MGEYALFFRGRDGSRRVRATAAWEADCLNPPCRLLRSARESRGGLDSIESWFQRLMDEASLINEVTLGPVAAISPVVRVVVGRYR